MRAPPIMSLLIALFAAPLFAQSPATPPAATTPAAPAPAPATPDPNAPAPAPAATGSWVGGHARRPLDNIPPEQRLTLTAGSEQFPARYIADLTGQPRGAVLLLHDAGQHPTWPFTLAALFEELPLHGWNTLAIELPTPAAVGSPEAVLAPAAVAPTTAAPTIPTAETPPAEPPPPQTPPATAPASPNPNAAPTAALATPVLSALEMTVQARIAAGIQQLAPTPDGRVVLVGFGSGAIRAAEAIKLQSAGSGAGTPAALQALVLVGAENELTGMASTLPQLLPQSALPTLDLVQGEQRFALEAQELRRRAVLKQRDRFYRAVVLPPLNATSGSDSSALSKRIRGFLQQLPQPAGDPAAKSAPPAAVPTLP